MRRRGFEERQRVREERQRRAVEVVVAQARENGLRVEEPTVLNDLFSLMVHLKPAPVVARVATCMPRLRTPISDWLEREIGDDFSVRAGRSRRCADPGAAARASRARRSLDQLLDLRRARP
jgi:hypothetical protein